jgi:hypothetical protein
MFELYRSMKAAVESSIPLAKDGGKMKKRENRGKTKKRADDSTM